VEEFNRRGQGYAFFGRKLQGLGQIQAKVRAYAFPGLLQKIFGGLAKVTWGFGSFVEDMFNVCNIVPACTRELDGLRQWGVG
jgi:hypothetical protein